MKKSSELINRLNKAIAFNKNLILITKDQRTIQYFNGKVQAYENVLNYLTNIEPGWAAGLPEIPSKSLDSFAVIW